MLDERKLYVVSSSHEGWEYAIATSQRLLELGDSEKDPHYNDYAIGFSIGQKLDIEEVVITDTKDLEDNRELLKHVNLYEKYKDNFEEMYS